MIEEAINIIKEGDPSKWPKNKVNREKVYRLERVYRKVFNNDKDLCGWCSRAEMYKHLKKYLIGNGHMQSDSDLL